MVLSCSKTCKHSGSNIVTRPLLPVSDFLELVKLYKVVCHGLTFDCEETRPRRGNTTASRNLRVMELVSVRLISDDLFPNAITGDERKS